MECKKIMIEFEDIRKIFVAAFKDSNVIIKIIQERRKTCNPKDLVLTDEELLIKKMYDELDNWYDEMNLLWHRGTYMADDYVAPKKISFK